MESSVLDNFDWTVYNVYGSKNNRETLESLYRMTLDEFTKYEEYVRIKDCLDYAVAKDNEPKDLKGT